MLSSLKIENFKKFELPDTIPLSQSVVFIGPNNSGKTTALQALSLWYLGLNKWLEKRGEKSKAKQNTGVAINRKDILSIPTPDARLLWNNLATKGKKSEKITIKITVEGTSNGEIWKCPLAFDYFGEEVLYCKPTDSSENIIISKPELLRETRIAYLPPMSGLTPQEPKLLLDTVNARIGEGRTADVLRNLCYFILNPERETQKNGLPPQEKWKIFTEKIDILFGVQLSEPLLNQRGEIELTYKDRNGIELDLSSAGRGLQQVMLLLAYLNTNPKSVLLLDEPDAHLEILRQRQVYNLISEIAREQGSQVISASHSEIVMSEAAERDVVIAFVGNPHQINDKGSQVIKSLTSIGFDNYYLAELKKWVIYLEGPSDLEILRKVAIKLKHPVSEALQSPFVHYVGTNLPQNARDHFFGLREAAPQLRGIAIFDKLEKKLNTETPLLEVMWTKREIENYFFNQDLFLSWAQGKPKYDLFASKEAEDRVLIMKEALDNSLTGAAKRNKDDSFWSESKASDVMDSIFKYYFEKQGMPVQFSKHKYFELIDYVHVEDINKEIKEKLDLIYRTAEPNSTKTNL